MNLHLGLKSKVCLSLLLVLSFLSAEADEEGNNGLVEVQHYQDNLAPYRDRRSDNGMYFAVVYEPIAFKNYISVLDGSSYGTMFGSSAVPIISANISYKRNMAIGSLAGGFIYGAGELSATDAGAVTHKLSISKMGLDFRFTADNFMPEPYVAPYFGMTFWKMGISEDNGTDKFNANTQMGYNYSIGALIQLDWIDYETAKKATFDYGLENTYLDVFATQYAKTQAADDPNTSTDFILGGGLRMEF
jgi:hypothetical protein